MSAFEDRRNSAEAKFAEDQNAAFRARTAEFHDIVESVAQKEGKDNAWLDAAKEKATRILVSTAPAKAKEALVDYIVAETGWSREEVESISK